MAHLVIGGGYLGGRVARLWRDAGKKVVVMTRSTAKAAKLEKEDLNPYVADIMLPQSLRSLPEAEQILFAVGYDRQSKHSLPEVYVEGLKNLLNVVAGRVERFIYISTTGVYGAGKGEWVDEASPCQPSRPGAAAHLEAENILRASDCANQALIFRLAGIYGPGRIPRKADLVAGNPIEGNESGWINLIHVDDAAEILSSVTPAEFKQALFLMADGQPVQRRDFYLELARLLETPPPRFAKSDPSNLADSRRWAPGKRIRNDLLMATFSHSLRYPTFREGLASAVKIIRDI